MYNIILITALYKKNIDNIIHDIRNNVINIKLLNDVYKPEVSNTNPELLNYYKHMNITIEKLCKLLYI